MEIGKEISLVRSVIQSDDTTMSSSGMNTPVFRRSNSTRLQDAPLRSLKQKLQHLATDGAPNQDVNPCDPPQKSSESETDLEKRRLYPHSDEKDIPCHKNVFYIKTVDSQHLMSLASATAYGLVGLLMGFVNKAVLIQWPYPISFLALQMVASIMVVYTMQLWNLATVRPLTIKAAKALLPVVFFYNTNVAFALAAVRALSIPVYHVLKRLTPVMVLIGKFLMGGDPPSKMIALSVVTVVSGCVMAGLGDLSFDWRGYSAALTSCALQSTYLLLVERSGSEKGFNSIELLLYNGILSLPVLLVIILGTGEVWVSMDSLTKQSRESSAFLPLLAASLLMGSLLNYCLFLCTLCNSALTTTIVGTLRSVLGTVMGFFVFGGVKGTNFIFLGVTFNTIGGVWYTIIKFNEKQSKEQAPSLEQQQQFQKGAELNVILKMPRITSSIQAHEQF